MNREVDGANPSGAATFSRVLPRIAFPERNVFCLAGFSDKALQTMRFLEEDKSALLRKVEAIEL